MNDEAEYFYITWLFDTLSKQGVATIMDVI